MFQPVKNPFSKYADKLERKVNRLLKRVTTKSRFFIQKELEKIMQKNLVITNLWLEKQFKGYKYLRKGKRKKMHKNTQIIVNHFNEFVEKTNADPGKVLEYARSKNFQLTNPDAKERLIYLYKIAQFLQPNRYYQYLEGASFGKLLTNITHEPMIGDCNQIVTFYTYLYSLKYPIRELQIKILPKHVCLHYNGMDIEATNATFQHYEEYEALLSIVELISTNLLDTSDFRDKQLQIDARTFINGAKLAKHISSMTQIVDKNLKVAYHNLALETAKQHNFSSATFFADKIHDPDLTKYIYQKAVTHFTKKHNFRKAKYFANKSRDRELMKHVYAMQFNQIQKKVKHLKKASEHKSHIKDYKKMRDLAGKMGDTKLRSDLNKFIGSLPK
ncbi:hypothetical protein GF340_06020 [Candidatus Peregrinibacteria bacterium]|nr:hypothetical protein [Candidatus Peregrinibacteria bacterium]